MPKSPGSPSGSDSSEPERTFPLARPPAHVLERLRAQLAVEPPAPPTARGRKWLTLPLAAIALLSLDVIVRHNSLLRADARDALDVGIPGIVAALIVALLTTLAASSRGKDGLGARVSVLRWSALAVGPLSSLPMLLLMSRGPQPALEQQLDPWGLPCFVIAAAMAAISLFVLIGELRNSVPVAAGWRSAALGSAAGAWAGLALLLHCPGAEAKHLAMGHLLPICLFPLLGLLFARRTLRL